MTNVDVNQLYIDVQKQGLVPALYNVFGKSLNLSLPLGEKFLQKSIDELDLSARSQNCLIRKNVRTIDDLAETIDNPDGLANMRGIGAKSVNEIKTKLMALAYDNMSKRQKLEFLKDLVDKNQRI